MTGNFFRNNLLQMEEIILMEEQTIIIGAGPCGLSCALELQKADINPLIIEKEILSKQFIVFLHIKYFLVQVLI